MLKSSRKSERQGLRLSALILASLICIAGFLYERLTLPQPPAGGWRRIDLEAVQRRLDSGELVRQEARWYRREAASDKP